MFNRADLAEFEAQMFEAGYTWPILAPNGLAEE